MYWIHEKIKLGILLEIYTSQMHLSQIQMPLKTVRSLGLEYRLEERFFPPYNKLPRDKGEETISFDTEQAKNHLGILIV